MPSPHGWAICSYRLWSWRGSHCAIRQYKRPLGSPPRARSLASFIIGFKDWTPRSTLELNPQFPSIPFLQVSLPLKISHRTTSPANPIPHPTCSQLQLQAPHNHHPPPRAFCCRQTIPTQQFQARHVDQVGSLARLFPYLEREFLILGTRACSHPSPPILPMPWTRRESSTHCRGCLAAVAVSSGSSHSAGSQGRAPAIAARWETRRPALAGGGTASRRATCAR